MLILAVTFASFWVYGLIAHREPAYVPLSLRAHVLGRLSFASTAAGNPVTEDMST